MKKLALALAVSVAALSAVPAHADGYYRHGHRGYYGNRGGGNWVAPLIGGAIIGGIIANQYRPAPPRAYYPPEVYVDPAYPQPIYPSQTVCRPVQVVDQYGYPYWTQQCWQQ